MNKREKENKAASSYGDFLESKRQLGGNHGFEPIEIPSYLFDFQTALVTWALKRGRSAIFADCGLGKTPMQLVWSDNVMRHAGGSVLVLTPLGVTRQTVHEGEKFHVDTVRSQDGTWEGGSRIVVANYERLHKFDPSKFVGCVCDESSILKNFDGVTKAAVTEFMRRIPYRLLCTATAAPNDFIELGTSSEAIGELGFMDMIGRFFKKQTATTSRSDEFRSGTYRFRGHAERDFWRWVCSWGRAVRKPSDLGFDDGKFVLPKLRTTEHIVSAKTKRDGWLIEMPAITLEEQRDERRRTIKERCELAAELATNHKGATVSWCHLNDEGHMLERMIDGAVEVEGADTDERKEEIFDAFEQGQIKKLVTKPTIAGFGLNWQHCHHQTFFPSHSFEQWYQAIRRCWRFGQKKEVRVDVISSEGEAGVVANLRRKSEAADRMFAKLVELMNDTLQIKKQENIINNQKNPSWL
jgi:hypothetical protein